MKSIANCYITGLETKGRGGIVGDLIEYYIEVKSETIVIRIDTSLNILENHFFLKHKHIYKGLILNGFWPYNKKEIKNEKDLKKILSISNYPKTIDELVNSLLLRIGKLQFYYGQEVSEAQILNNLVYEQLYLRNHEEFEYFIDVLRIRSYINLETSSHSISLNLTIDGNEKINQILEHGELSNNCFIAMSFGEGLNGLRTVIKDVCNACGYNPILIDEVIIESDKTINDAIIANIKKSKFCIADFTEQKMGVYFEAGYALGRGQQVLYLCNKEWFSKTHFDTNHFPHIIYENINDLRIDLTNRIEAWIK